MSHAADALDQVYVCLCSTFFLLPFILFHIHTKAHLTVLCACMRGRPAVLQLAVLLIDRFPRGMWCRLAKWIFHLMHTPTLIHNFTLGVTETAVQNRGKGYAETHQHCDCKVEHCLVTDDRNVTLRDFWSLTTLTCRNCRHTDADEPIFIMQI